MIAAHTVTNLHYLISKDKSDEQARSMLTDMPQFLSVATVSQETIEQALILPYTDFEDAVQMMSAVQYGVHYNATRNIRTIN